MKYDEDQIKVEYIEIEGKKVPIYRVPTGMCGPNQIKFYDEVDIPENEEDEDSTDIKSIEELSESSVNYIDEDVDF